MKDLTLKAGNYLSFPFDLIRSAKNKKLGGGGRKEIDCPNLEDFQNILFKFLTHFFVDPFFEISVASPTNSSEFIKTYRSEVVKQSLAPEWFPIDVSPLFLPL
jgi:hypothetical protein